MPDQLDDLLQIPSGQEQGLVHLILILDNNSNLMKQETVPVVVVQDTLALVNNNNLVNQEIAI